MAGTSYKRITHNFERMQLFTQEQKQEFKEWKDNLENKHIGYVYDRRNGVYCAEPTGDFHMYYNYLMYLNSCRDEWIKAGYLDAGLLPYIMLPDIAISEKSESIDKGISVVRSSIDNVMFMMQSWTRKCGVDLVQVPAVTFLKNSCVSSMGMDYWIFREDLLRLMEYTEITIPASGVTTEGLTVDNVTTSGFIQHMADFYDMVVATGKAETLRRE